MLSPHTANERPTRLSFPLRKTMIIIWRDPSPIYVTYRQPPNDAKEKISQSCWSLLSKLYLSRNWLQSRPPATGNDQGHGSRQDLQTSHSDTATTHKNTNSNMNMTLNYNHKEKKCLTDSLILARLPNWGSHKSRLPNVL